jgi:hypothetical protein
MRLVFDIYNWTMAEQWRTWLFHFLLAIVLSVVFSPWTAAVFYMLREFEQNALKLAATGDFDGRDAVLDALAPILGASLVALTGWLA